MRGFWPLVSLWLTIAGSLCAPGGRVLADEKTIQSNATPSPSAGDLFAGEIEPLLRTRCFACHGVESQEGGLRLDVRKRAMEGGDSGKAIIGGDSEQSLLIQRVAGLDELSGPMPPEGEGTPLTKEEIHRLSEWIEQGAVWPDEKAGQAKSADHWSFLPIQRRPLPAVKDSHWPRNAIDQFVLARLEEEGIQPAKLASRATLIRRLYLDLLGLVPSPAEVDRFLADRRADAYERLVERLLASPHFGERWTRHWLDLARYADSDGYEKDRPRPNAWRYREWVLSAINSDLPFDQFTLGQLAGDMLPEATIEQSMGTGFHRNTLHNTEGGIDPEEDRVKKTVDRTNTVGTIWMGLTVGCAQCHSHKYDPLTQREYYSLYSFFDSMDEKDIALPQPATTDPEKADAGKEKKKDVPKAQAVSQRTEPRQTKIHLRGDFLSPGDPVSPETPSFLPPLLARGEQPDRLDLAHWIAGPDHPLMARVTANRIWSLLLGRGLVFTVDDFGSQGEPPSHPALLDWLAAEFRDQDWSVKRLARLIVCSATYRQSAAVRLDLLDVDPENALLARQSRSRVEAEIIRDLALTVSGLLDRRLGGPSVRPPQSADYAKLTYANSAKWQVSKGGDAYRRGLYTFFQRTSPYPMLVTFDSPDSNICCPQRNASNTPLQALTVWNDRVFFECAQALGRRIVQAVPSCDDACRTTQQRARHAFRLCMVREPEAGELDELVELYESQLKLTREDEAAARDIAGALPLPPEAAPGELAAWITVGRTLLNLDEFITRE